MARRNPTQEQLREMFTYDPTSGRLFWRRRPRQHFSTDAGWRRFNGQFAGKEFGGECRRGRYRWRQGFIGGVAFLTHRLVYALLYGEWPEEIDHEDQNALNNRPGNLRAANHRANGLDQPRYRNNTSGVAGVSKTPGAATWRAHIVLYGRQRHLGCHSNFFEAVAARKSAEVEHGFHRNHGKGATGLGPKESES